MKKYVFQFITCIRDGGAETLVKDYALNLESNDVVPIVVTLWPPDQTSANYKVLKSSDIPIISIYEKYLFQNCWVLLKIWNRLFHNSYVCHRLKKFIEQYHPIAIHAHLTVLDHVARLKTALNGITVIYTCHSKPERYINNGDMRCELRAAKYLYEKQNFRIIALHDAMRTEINEMFRVNNTIVVPNGVNFSKYNITETAAEIRKEIGIPEKSFVVGHVGRFSYMKNHAFLIDIFLEVLKRKPEAFLFMVGDGEKKNEIVDKLNKLGLDNHYKILSHRTDVPRLLNAMDVFVFPSTFEGLPVSVVEAQVARLRCVISDAVTEECFFGQEAVPMSLFKSPSEWADAVLDDTIKGPYQHYISDFDMKNVMVKLKNLYTNVF